MRWACPYEPSGLRFGQRLCPAGRKDYKGTAHSLWVAGRGAGGVGMTIYCRLPLQLLGRGALRPEGRLRVEKTISRQPYGGVGALFTLSVSPFICSAREISFIRGCRKCTVAVARLFLWCFAPLLEADLSTFLKPLYCGGVVLESGYKVCGHFDVFNFHVELLNPPTPSVESTPILTPLRMGRRLRHSLRGLVYFRNHP